MRRLEYAFACIAALTCSALAHAQTRVHVRAASELELRAQRLAAGDSLQGMLLDDSGAPLAGRSVQLALQGEVGPDMAWHWAHTQADGSFQLQLSGQSERPHGRAVARFVGDADHAASERQVDFDFGRAELELRFSEPHDGRIDLDGDEARLSLRASSAWGGGGLDVVIEDGGDRSLARGRTDRAGWLHVAVPLQRFEPGPMTLVARSTGDSRRAPAHAELISLAFRRSSLSLQARFDPELGRLLLRGQLRDQSGPLPERAIGLFDGDRHLVTLWTDAGGGFRLAQDMAAREAADARVAHLQARFESAEAALGASRSPVIDAEIVTRAPASLLWLFAPAALCAIAAVSWRRGERTRAAAAAPPVPIRSAGVHAHAPTGPGLAHVFEIGGVILDLERAQPLHDVHVYLANAHASRLELAIDRAGNFRSAALAPGRWTLEAGAPGHASVTHEFAIPHRGPYSSMDVRLQGLRGAALAAYKHTALRWLPVPDLWGRWTPREILEHAAEGGSTSQALSQLTERVERAAYGPTSPTPDEVDTIRDEAEALLQASGTPRDTG